MIPNEDFGGLGEVWKFRAVKDGTPTYFIECCGGEEGSRISHYCTRIHLTPHSQDWGEKFCVIDLGNNIVQLKYYGENDDVNYYMGHVDGQQVSLHRDEVNSSNSYWKIGHHEE